MRTEAYIKWTQQLIAKEFGMDSRTVGKRLAAAGLRPSSDGYRTPDVVKAIIGDHDREKLLKTTAERKLLELELGEEEGRLCEADVVRQFCEAIASSMRQTIRAFTINETDKAKLMQQLRETDAKNIIEKLIARASKGRAGKPKTSTAPDGKPME